MPLHRSSESFSIKRNIDLNIYTTPHWNQVRRRDSTGNQETNFFRKATRNGRITGSGQVSWNIHSSRTRAARTSCSLPAAGGNKIPVTCVLESPYDLLPSVTVALVDGEYDPLTIAPMDHLSSSNHSGPFTHVIRIHYSTFSTAFDMHLEPGMVWSQYDDEASVSVLNLVIPTDDEDIEAQAKPAPERRVTSLNGLQLLLAKDFLSLYLPFYDSGDWESDTALSDDVHVLITAPCSRPRKDEAGETWHRQYVPGATDIISILACYIAFISKRRIRDVLKTFKVEMELDQLAGQNASLWKNRVAREGWSLLDQLARLG